MRCQFILSSWDPSRFIPEQKFWYCKDRKVIEEGVERLDAASFNASRGGGGRIAEILQKPFSENLLVILRGSLPAGRVIFPWISRGTSRNFSSERNLRGSSSLSRRIFNNRRVASLGILDNLWHAEKAFP